MCNLLIIVIPLTKYNKLFIIQHCIVILNMGLFELVLTYNFALTINMGNFDGIYLFYEHIGVIKSMIYKIIYPLNFGNIYYLSFPYNDAHQ